MDEITILIIEDDEDIRESVKILLENEGFHVIEADNGMHTVLSFIEDNGALTFKYLIGHFQLG